MRRRVWLLALLAVAGAVAIAAPALTQSGRARPNLVVSAAPEPPDFEFAGNSFRLAFTVANEARGRARASRAAAFLSPNAARGTDDVRLGTGARVPALRGGRQATRRMTARIPATLPPGVYFLLVCADVAERVAETRNGDNCSVSGQRVGINAVPSRAAAGDTGPPGAQGAQGPAGVAGAPTGDILRRLRPTTIDIAQPGTEQRDALTVGPLVIRIECVNDDGTTPPDVARIYAINTEGVMHTRLESDVPEDQPTQLLAGDRLQHAFERILLTFEQGQEYLFVGMAGVEVFGAGTAGEDGDDPCFFAGALLEATP
jgi:hypothetical protein